MKKALVVLVSVLASLSTLAQQVNFSNKDAAKNINSPIYDVTVGGTKLEGTAYFAQLFGGAAGSAESALVALGTPVNFRTGAAAGYISANTVTIPGVGFGAGAVVQMRAWASANGTYTTWDAAQAAYTAGTAAAEIGKSGLLNVTMPASAVDPNVPGLVGLESFAIVGPGPVIPEPSTMALCLLGAAALLIRRDRKSVV